MKEIRECVWWQHVLYTQLTDPTGLIMMSDSLLIRASLQWSWTIIDLNNFTKHWGHCGHKSSSESFSHSQLERSISAITQQCNLTFPRRQHNHENTQTLWLSAANDGRKRRWGLRGKVPYDKGSRPVRVLDAKWAIRTPIDTCWAVSLLTWQMADCSCSHTNI